MRVRQGMVGRGDGYQCGLDWGRSSINSSQLLCSLVRDLFPGPYLKVSGLFGRTGATQIKGPTHSHNILQDIHIKASLNIGK